MMEIPPKAPPPDCGRRLIPKLIDHIASTDPQRSFVSITRSSVLHEGFEDISYSRFANAINACAWWLESHVGRGKSDTILYIGPLDIRYLIIVIAAVKTGHVAFLSSHRNSVQAHLSLLERIGCELAILPTRAPAVIKAILQRRPMRTLSMPELDEFLDRDDKVKIYPWLTAFEECVNQTLVILHTSGSTGIPKPVYVTHGTFAANDAHQLIPSFGGMKTFGDYISGKRYFVALPLFHAANLTFTLGFGIFRGAICVLPPPVPLTADVAHGVHKHGDIYGSLLPPSLMVDIYNNAEYLKTMMQKQRFVSYVGGTLHKEIGDLISSKMKLITLMGSTETMLFPIEIHEDHTDWEYIFTSPYLGYEPRPGRDGLYELVIVRDDKLRPFQGVFSTFPDIHEYAMRDLYEPHPTRSNAWAFRARADDIIALSNAEKLNPVTMESIISAHPAIQSAIIAGQGQFQTSLVVEPRGPIASEEDRQDLLSKLWPTVVQANRDCPAHGRIMKDYIIFTTPEKPMPRSGKGTVQRYATLQAYANEIGSLYATKTKSVSKDRSSSMPPNTMHETKGLGVAPSLESEVQASGLGIRSEDERSDSRRDDTEIYVEAILRRLLPDLISVQLKSALPDALLALQPGAVTQSNINAATDQRVASVRQSSTADPVQSDYVRGCPLSANASELQQTVTHPHTTLSALESSSDLRAELYGALARSTYLYNLSDTADFFECGLDSLQVPALVDEINNLLLTTTDVGPITAQIIYGNPSVERLLAALQALPCV